MKVFGDIDPSTIPPPPTDFYKFDHPGMVQLRNTEQAFRCKADNYSRNNPDLYNSIMNILNGARYYADNLPKPLDVRSLEYWVERMEAIRALLLNENCDPVIRDWFVAHDFLLDAAIPRMENNDLV
jgi:hypothetical protein